jgi:hypothetical protein
VGEFASRGPTHAGASYANAGTTSSPAREASPADRARDAVASATHKLTLVREAVAELTAAHDANDLPRWNHAHKAVEAALVQANRRFQQTRTQLTGASPETTSTFEAATCELATATERTHTAEPPKGYVQVALEAELLAALRAPSVAGFAGRRDAVHGELDQLAIAELRVLRARIASPQPQDELAAEIWKLGPKLRQEVADFIHTVDRRKARERAAEARRKPAPLAPEPASLDSKLRRAFEGHDAETELLAVIAPLDLAARRTLATRLRTYRQGSGDDVAARFSRLERDVQSRILADLAQPPVLDAVHAPVPVMAAQPAPAPTVAAPVVATPAFDDRSKCEIEAARPHARAPRSVPGWEARTFAVTHAPQLIAAISNRILDLGVPDPHPRLFWRGDGGRFVSQQLRSDLELAPGSLDERVDQLTSQKVISIATRVLEQRGGIDELGLEVAVAFDRPISDAVTRIGARVRATMDASGAAADPSHVVVGSHLDRIVADAMQGNVAGATLARNEKAEVDGRNLSHGPRHVELEWLGRTRGADLWNWIVVKTPHDATAEDVASTPLANGKTIGLENADRIASSPPYFGIPAEFARLAKDAIDYAPPAVKTHPEAATVVDASALAHSTASDGAALAQARPATRADVTVEHALDRLDLELDAVQRMLTPWGADAPIAAALAFVARRKAELAKSPDAAAHWKTVLSEQERVVHEVADELETFTSRAKPHASAAHDQAVRAFAHTVEVSHLAAQARPALAKARELVAMLPLTQLEHDLVASAGASEDPDGALAIARRAADIRTTIERGTADPDSMAEVLVDGDEHALHAQLTSLGQRLDAIDRGAQETGIPDGDFANGLPTLHALSSQVRKRVAHWNDLLAKASHFAGPQPGLTAKQAVTAQRRRALDQIGAELQAAYKDLEVDKYLAWAQCTIADRKRVAAIVKLVVRLAAEIAIMIASMQLATAAIAAVRGVMTGVEIVESAREASLAVRLATAVVGAGIDTTANGALLGGELTPKAYAENAVAMVTMTALMAPFNGLLGESAEIESGLRGLGRRAVRTGAELVLEGATGYAGSVAGHAAVNGFTIASPTSGDILEQGFTLLVGKFVHQRTSAMSARIDAAAARLGADAVADLRGRLTKLERGSAKEQLGKDEALALLEERQQLLVAERGLYKGHPELEATMAHEPALGAHFVDVPLVLSKLEPVVRGHSYLGTSEAIEDGIDALKTSGLDPKRLPEEVPGRRRVQVGDRIIELAERGSSARARTSASGEHVDFTAGERKLIAHLDELSRQLADTKAHANEANARVAQLEARIAQTEKALGIAGDGELAKKRRHSAAVQREIIADAPRREAVKQELDGTRGHAGVELHSHFMGIVEPDVFRQRAATAGGAKDTGSWKPLLEQIEHLPELENAYYRSQGKQDEPTAFEHGRTNGRIDKRAKAGDAVEIATGALDQIKALETRAALSVLESDRLAYQRAVEVLAEEACRTALTSTSETSFDGAYEIIDALVKTTFGGNPVDGETAAAREQRAFDDYIEQALLRLAETGTSYSEQSTGINKLETKVHPDRIRAALDRLIAAGKIRPGQLEIKMLGMVTTKNYGEREQTLPPVGGQQSIADAGAQNEKALKQTRHDGNVGRDIGGPEAYTFNEKGAEQYKRDYRAMIAEAVKTGHTQVDRPHIGEGSVDTIEGKAFNTDKNRVVRNNEPAHYERARSNLDKFLDAAEDLQREGVWDPARVITRFGHATHATPRQTARMRALGIIAEVNLGSNVVTGSLSQTEGAHGPRAREPRYQDHSLPSLIYSGTSVVLSTDGPGVMNTTLATEYARANQIIEAVLTGEQPVRITTSDATISGIVRGTEVSGLPDVRELYIDELTAAERARFTSAYEKLYADASQYVLRRPKPNGSLRASLSTPASCRNWARQSTQGAVRTCWRQRSAIAKPGTRSLAIRSIPTKPFGWSCR